MKNLLLIFMILLLFGCEIKERIETLSEVESAMKTELRHQDIDLVMNWGEKSYVVITFYNYNFEGQRWDKLESIALKAKDFALASDPELKDLTHILVVFTDSGEGEEPSQQASFKIGSSAF